MGIGTSWFTDESFHEAMIQQFIRQIIAAFLWPSALLRIYSTCQAGSWANATVAGMPLELIQRPEIVQGSSSLLYNAQPAMTDFIRLGPYISSLRLLPA